MSSELTPRNKLDYLGTFILRPMPQRQACPILKSQRYLRIVHDDILNGNPYDRERLPKIGVPFPIQQVILGLWTRPFFPEQKPSIYVKAVPHLRKP